MKELNSNQILYIENDLVSKGLDKKKIREEILDHVCCLVEKNMSLGLKFPEAYQEAILSFDDIGFKVLKKDLSKNVRRMPILNKKIIISGLAASIMFFVIVVDARDRPDIHPLNKNHHITSGFGERKQAKVKKVKFHTGIDIKAPVGTSVMATASGKIIKATRSEGYGIYIIIKHDEQYETMYAHLSELKVEEGQMVKKGEVIGLSGNTGRSTGPHLHYEVRKNGKNVNPELYLGYE